MLRRFQSLFNPNKSNHQNNVYSNTNRNSSIESWTACQKAQLYSQESIQETTTTLSSIDDRSIQDKARDQHIEQHVQAGIEHHELGQLEKATNHFRLASKDGSPIGMFLYGISLRHGWGCKANTALAFQYLQTAAEHAVNDLLQGKVFSLVSKGELIMAIYELGVSFQQGWGVNKNKETAFYYFEIAANLGDLDAMNDVAFCYNHGHGVKKDIFKAAQYYRMASRQGHVQVGNSWIWKEKYNVVDTPNWDKNETKK